ncbi:MULTISPECIES: hypothetical protein [Legionella]|uniref:Uncharacterized protein n=1 Tax=Legionella quinlivanii TaxID=45073 RepID=A0A364LN83_9GAMM|nr:MULTISPECIES: hypothetical protein [Legionella]MCE3046201.1 hypothetical protein [Legionella sp. 16cNR16C]RAP38517.1 hypothetical protein B1207_01120 [Legionella quinlivanii]
MPFNIPKLATLISRTKSISEVYAEERSQRDDNRSFITRWAFGKTDNKKRKQDTYFIEALANGIEANKGGYGNLDEEFKITPDMSQDDKLDRHDKKEAFLARVITGACIYALIKIDAEYKGNEEKIANSALASVIFKTYEFNKLSEIPIADVKSYLNDLDRYIDKMTKPRLPLVWHEQFQNTTLLRNDITSWETEFVRSHALTV